MFRTVIARFRTRVIVAAMLPYRTHPSSLPCLSSPLLEKRRFQSTSDEEFGSVFDPTATIQREAAAAQADQLRDRILKEWLPADAPDAAINKLRKSLHEFPIDGMIVCPRVKITHVEDDEGVEKSMKLEPVDRDEALEQASLRKKNLVQMAERDGVAFARIRDEKKRIMKLLEPDLQTDNAASSDRNSEKSNQRLKPGIDHVFRDVVDAHFISWKSKKIAQDLKRMHPVKLAVQEFQSADSAVSKLREMCNAIKAFSEQNKIYHHYTSIHATDREFSVTLSPSIQGQKNSSVTVKHPGEKEWNNAVNRLGGALRASGRMGTYSKAQELKPRNVGAQPFRVDKYGRKIE